MAPFAHVRSNRMVLTMSHSFDGCDRVASMVWHQEDGDQTLYHPYALPFAMANTHHPILRPASASPGGKQRQQQNPQPQPLQIPQQQQQQSRMNRSRGASDMGLLSSSLSRMDTAKKSQNITSTNSVSAARPSTLSHFHSHSFTVIETTVSPRAFNMKELQQSLPASLPVTLMTVPTVPAAQSDAWQSSSDDFSGDVSTAPTSPVSVCAPGDDLGGLPLFSSLDQPKKEQEEKKEEESKAEKKETNKPNLAAISQVEFEVESSDEEDEDEQLSEDEEEEGEWETDSDDDGIVFGIDSDDDEEEDDDEDDSDVEYEYEEFTGGFVVFGADSDDEEEEEDDDDYDSSDDEEILPHRRYVRPPLVSCLSSGATTPKHADKSSAPRVRFAKSADEPIVIRTTTCIMASIDFDRWVSSSECPAELRAIFGDQTAMERLTAIEEAKKQFAAMLSPDERERFCNNSCMLGKFEFEYISKLMKEEEEAEKAAQKGKGEKKEEVINYKKVGKKAEVTDEEDKEWVTDSD